MCAPDRERRVKPLAGTIRSLLQWAYRSARQHDQPGQRTGCAFEQPSREAGALGEIRTPDPQIRSEIF